MHKMKCLYFPTFKRFFSKIVIQLELYSDTAIINAIQMAFFFIFQKFLRDGPLDPPPHPD